MFERLNKMRERYLELNGLIGDPEVMKDIDEWRKLVKEHAALEEIVQKYEEYLKISAQMDECKAMMDGQDNDLKELAEIEYYELRDKREEVVNNIKIALIPKDPMDDKNVIIEIRGGAGGDEAALFAMDLNRMYHRFAERMRWKVEDLLLEETGIGGAKEVTFMMSGKSAYSKMKYESGVHRVQRVPETEAQGRIHTSTVTVAVLPEVEEVNIEIDEKDLKIDTYRSGGAGGQHINKTDSAVRMTHLPTGIVVSCQDERSQIKNREKAMRVLKAKLYDFYQSQKDTEYAQNRKNQVGTGDRSEKIRTYNYPQGRVTDHRIGMTIYTLPTFMDGDILSMIQALEVADQAAKLAGIDN
ncbi:MAG: peptide chain release factor 1 [Clostridia bacterium]|nr:peptide chain release factor 1 [Clostridia bacterium]